MTYRAIAIHPDNATVIFEELDLIIDYTTIDKAYLVHGFPGPIEYIFYTKKEFDEEWRFLLGQEQKGQFTLVMATSSNRGY